MKTIGIIGGMTWVSTIDYYRIINQETNRRLGGVNSAKILLHSFNFQELADFQASDNHDKVGDLVVGAGRKLKAGGADFVIFAANTTHMFADKFRTEVDAPFLSIVDVVAKAIHEKGLKTVALLGTKFTMQKEFYKEGLSKHGIKTLVPKPEVMSRVHAIIHDELFKEIISADSKTFLLKLIDELVTEGAQGVILGCTELPLILRESDLKVPCFNTTELHALAAVDLALSPTSKS